MATLTLISRFKSVQFRWHLPTIQVKFYCRAQPVKTVTTDSFGRMRAQDTVLHMRKIIIRAFVCANALVLVGAAKIPAQGTPSQVGVTSGASN